jgi:hypothetical protein
LTRQGVKYRWAKFYKKNFLTQTDFFFHTITLKENYCEKFEDFHISFPNWVPGSYRDSLLIFNLSIEAALQQMGILRRSDDSKIQKSIECWLAVFQSGPPSNSPRKYGQSCAG